MDEINKFENLVLEQLGHIRAEIAEIKGDIKDIGSLLENVYEGMRSDFSVTRHSNGTTYENDIVAWANEQAALLRAGKFTAIDIEHIAEEIEDVGKSEQRELENRMAVLLAHLLRWQFQQERQCSSWAATVNDQRKRIARRVQKTPSLKASLKDQEWWDDAWTEARVIAERETGLNDFPEVRPWSVDDVLADGWLPSDGDEV